MKGLLASLALLAIAIPASAYEWIRVTTTGEVETYARFESRFDGEARIDTQMYLDGKPYMSNMPYTISFPNAVTMITIHNRVDKTYIINS